MQQSAFKEPIITGFLKVDAIVLYKFPLPVGYSPYTLLWNWNSGNVTTSDKLKKHSTNNQGASKKGSI